VVPLPGLLLAARRPDLVAVWWLITALALSICIGASGSIGFAITLGVATMVVTVGIVRSWKLELAVATAIGVWTIGVGTLYLASAGEMTSAVSTATEQVDQAFAMALEASKAAGADAEALALLETERETLVRSVLRVLPGLVALTGGAILSANIAMVRRMLPVFEAFQLRYWRAPEMLIWAFIAAGFGMFAPMTSLSIVATNVFVVLLGCYFVQGLAVVAYYLERFGLPMSLRVGTYLLIGIQQLLTAIVLALGIFDLWGDFRRLQTGAADASLSDSD
jgi:uncharacterized protein YybS (DUF2232 family)